MSLGLRGGAREARNPSAARRGLATPLATPPSSHPRNPQPQPLATPRTPWGGCRPRSTQGVAGRTPSCGIYGHEDLKYAYCISWAYTPPPMSVSRTRFLVAAALNTITKVLTEC